LMFLISIPMMLPFFCIGSHTYLCGVVVPQALLLLPPIYLLTFCIFIVEVATKQTNTHTHTHTHTHTYCWQNSWVP
jgi:hypothetical protein